MLKNYFPLVFVLFFLVSIYSQSTDIPDAHFEQALIDKGIDSDGMINQSILTSDISGVTFLNIASLEIEDLTGIEDFVSLTELYCANNQIKNLDLSGASSLSKIDCKYNELEKLNLKNGNNFDLESMLAYGNPLLECIQVDDVALAEQYTGYVWAIDSKASYSEDCYSFISIPDSNFEQALVNSGIDSDGIINQSISNVDVLAVLDLDVSSKNISNLTGIKHFKNISFLNCSNNQLTKLDLSLNPDLITINCFDNDLSLLNVKNGNNTIITEFNATNNPSLTCINVDNENNAIAGVGSYASWYKDVTSTYSEDCYPKTSVPDEGFERYLGNSGYDDAMDHYVLNSNIENIEQFGIPTTTCPHLGTPIQDLFIGSVTGIEGFTSLKRLTIEHQYFHELDLWNNKKLIYLSIILLNNPGLLNLTQNNLLAELHIINYYLPTIDLTKNIALKNLSIGAVNMLSIDLSKNIQLTTLAISGDNLISLDVTENIVLEKLLCKNNSSLTSLNVKNGNNSLITEFDARSNPALKCIDVDNENDANAGIGFYGNWLKDASTIYSEDCKSALGIDDEILNEAITLYPNPVSDILTIDSEIPLTKVEVYSMLGKKVKEINSDFTSIPIDNLSNGVYIVRMHSENGVVNRKIIKK